MILIARVVLAVVFAVAAVGKLADRPGTRGALVDFGVPESLADPGALVLPFAELTVSAFCLVGPVAVWGAMGALVLLAFFSTGIAVSLASGRRPDCHCFGQLHSAPAGPGTLARNAVFIVLAGLVLWRG
ncbi:MAG: DoxX family membrane protein [Actinobacteria bacterium]|nr:DoxX family membrane protein [Actinomycetota bacterium]MBV9256113.1 DoxX family membrane protein [Actinomycetota bacterium]MBV9665835.1 DoxX family membrane protein [Actinomycetota bacterium]